MFRIRGKAAFTLAELFVAIGLATLVFTVCAAALATGIRAWTAVVSASDENARRLEMLLDLQRDISCAAGFCKTDFVGNSSSMTFSTLSPHGRSENALRPEIVRWQKNTIGTITRTSKPAGLFGKTTLKPDERKYFISSVFSLRYAGDLESKVSDKNTMDSRWLSEWKNKNPPKAVEVTLDGMKHVFAVMTASEAEKK